MTATVEERAKRRLIEIQQRGGVQSYEDVLADTMLRDKQDSERKISPLVKDPEKHGYVIINNSGLSKDQTQKLFIKELRKKGLLPEAMKI